MDSNVTMLQSLSCDNQFGPAATACDRPRFDFTVVFEQSILSIGPYTALLLAALPRLYVLQKKTRKVKDHSLSRAKQAAGIVLIGLQLGVLVSCCINYGPLATKLGVAASALGFATTFVLCALSWLEHRRTVRPSTILCTYYLLSTLFDAAQCRTLWLIGRDKLNSLPTLFSATLAAKVVLLFLEGFSKSGFLVGPWKRLKACPEAVSGIINRVVFWWVNDLLLRGFRASLSLDDLYENDDELQSEAVLCRLSASVSKRKPSKFRLLFSLMESLKWTLVKSALGRIALIGFKFAQPFLIQYTIEFVQDGRAATEEGANIGYALVGATGLIYIGSGVANGFYKHHVYRASTMIRGGLIALICSESLKISTATASESAILTLTGPDVGFISGAFEDIHEMWLNPIEIVLATWLLARQTGAACVGPMISVLLTTGIMSQVAKKMGPAIKAWNAAVQKRVTITSSVVGNIKETKMLGLVRVWLKHIQSLRMFELDRSKSFRMLMTYMNMIGNTTPSLAPILTFGITLALNKDKEGGPLSLSTAFTSLSIMSLIMGPLSYMLYAIPSFISAFSIFQRVEEFFEKAEEHTPSTSEDAQSTNHGTQDDIPLQSVSACQMIVQNASFAAKLGEAALLQDINFSVRPGTLTMITGKVGSGKSLLLQGLLGELLLTGGTLRKDIASIGYCAQSAWLVKGTVRRNIIGWCSNSDDDDWYDTVVKACALDKDFQQFSLGDQTRLSSKGLSLSGGQRHRVALARALYAKPPVLIIDDILSSLDKVTLKDVWDNVFGPGGLVRRMGSTAVVATHAMTLLKDADHVVVMDNRQISQQGPPSEVLGAVPSEEQETIEETDATDEEPQEKKSVSDAESEMDQEMKDLVCSTGDTSLYWYYLKSIGWKFSFIGIGFCIGEQFFGTFDQIWLRWWTEANDRPGDVNDGMYYGIYAMLLMLVVVFVGLDCWFMFVKIIPKSAKKLHWTLLNTTLHAPMTFFAATNIGDLINRFSQDMSLVDQELPTAVYTTLSGLLNVISAGALVIVGSKYLAVGIPVAMAVVYILQKFYLRTSRQLRLLGLQAKAPFYSHLVESGEGLATIRAFGWQKAVHADGMRLLNRSQRAHYLFFCIQRWLTFVLDMLVAAAAVILVTLAVVANTSSAGGVAIAMSNMLGFSSTLADFITSWTQLETSLGAISRLKAFESTTPQETEKLGTCDPPSSWPSSGQVTLQNMTASYTMTQDSSSSNNSSSEPITDDQLVLRNLSLTISSGQKVAICGRTGSGKSSLLLTLFRLLSHTGTSTIDGIDTTLIPHDTLRARLIAVPQEPIIFRGSIRSNLSPESLTQDPASDAQLSAALEKVNLLAVVEEAGGLDANVADVPLSHGQKQLLCLARAVLRKDVGRVLILDEAMSSVDGETEDLMAKVVEEEFAQHTVISVVHRMKTVRAFDRVITMDRGRVVSDRPPSDTDS